MILKKVVVIIGMLFSGILSIIGLSEFYKIRILKETKLYPFGGEGPVPYFYKTAELYANVNLIWGIIFLWMTFLGIWNCKTKKISEIKIIAVTFGLILLKITHSLY